MSEVKAITVHSQTNIDAPGFVMTPIGLVINGNPAFEEWELCGRRLALVEKAIHWAIGDWLNYGEQRWGEMYAQVIDEENFSYQTLRKDKYVALSVALFRRRNKLSWSHHSEVAPLAPSEQNYWLDRAIEGDADGDMWSRSRLRNEIRAWKKLKQLDAHTPETVTVDDAIIWGDCTQVEWPAEVDLIVADPPFGLTVGNSAGVRAAKGDWDDKEYAVLHEFNQSWLSLAVNSLRDEGSIFVFGTVHNIFSVGHILKELGCYIVRDIDILAI